MFRLCCLLWEIEAVAWPAPSRPDGHSRGSFRARMNAVEQSHPRGQPTQRTGNAVLDAWPLPSQGSDPEADEPLAREVEGDDEPITEENPAASASES